MPSSYVELHARTAFSFLHGASTPEEMVLGAREAGYERMAVCDLSGVYGIPRMHHRGREAGLQALVGVELVLEDATILPVLVKSRKGYQQLCQLLTRSHLRAAKGEGHIKWAELEGLGEGLVCLTGGAEGPVRTPLASGDLEKAAKKAQQLVDFFGRKNVYVEVQRHLIRGENWTNQCLADLASHLDLPLLVTNGVGYVEPKRRLLYDAFTCLRHHTHLDKAGDLLAPNAQCYLKRPEQMEALFADLPQAIEETARLADRLEFTLDNLGYAFPEYPTSGGESMAEVLRREAYAGAKWRYGKITPKICKQLDHELALITKLGFCGYFLIVWEIVNEAKRRQILVQGRGSAANSAVCYCLGITACDPIGGKLLFERFLSEGRHSWPDIDLDLPSGDQRERVIQSVYERFAPNGAAMTANVITYRGRSAMREMGKVLNLPEGVLGRFSDLHMSGKFAQTLEFQEQMHRAGLDRQHPRLPALASLYQTVLGFPRHLGQHSGGMVISDRGLDSIVPLENASMPGRVVVQWNKDDCEDLGIIKVDLLGLGMMAVIEETINLCRTRGPEREIDLAKIPKDDPATYEMMQKADTIGVFQIESRAQMATLPRMKPREFYDVVIEVAIIRPGPIVGNLVHPYLNRRNGKEPIDYIDERFQPVLERTLGVPLFQEQVLKMAMIIADFTGSQAEELRRAITFNGDRDRMERVLLKLKTAMEAKRVLGKTQERIIESIKSFALYGFPESHAISFALLAYASSWMKVHRAAEFYVALLNNQPMGFYSPATLIKDARRHGIRVRHVCVVRSDAVCTVEADDAIRLGFNQVRGLSEKGRLSLIQAREEKAYHHIEDLLIRTSLQKDERRVLAKLGAFNALGIERREALWRVERQFDQGDLFTWAFQQQAPKEEKSAFSQLPSMTPIERLVSDYEGVGMTTGPHPMAYFREELPGIWRASDLEQGKDGQRITVAGMVICRQRPGSAKGHLFISLEDETGISNAFVPSKTFERFHLVITMERFLKITGTLQNVDGVISIYTYSVEVLAIGQNIAVKSHDFH